MSILDEFKRSTEQFTEGFLELMEFRHENAGAKIVNQEAYERLQKEKKRHEPLARMHKQHGEARACSIFDYMYENCLLPDCIPADESTLVREYTFSSGKRVDRIIRHASRRLSVVEIKDACDQRAVVGGIGQALLYATLAEKDFSYAPIVPILAVLGDYDQDVARACERGGVEYIALGNIEYLTLMSKMVSLMIS